MKKVLTAVLALFITMPAFAQEDKSFGEAFSKSMTDYCHELVDAEYGNAVKFIRTKYLNNTQGEFPSYIALGLGQALTVSRNICYTREKLNSVEMASVGMIIGGSIVVFGGGLAFITPYLTIAIGISGLLLCSVMITRLDKLKPADFFRNFTAASVMEANGVKN